jgi:hypothetical protein
LYLKNKYRIVTRDWKGTYSLGDKVNGMVFVGGEDNIETGGDCFALVFAENKTKLSAQEIYDIYEKLQSEKVEGFLNDFNDQDVIIEI